MKKEIIATLDAFMIGAKISAVEFELAFIGVKEFQIVGTVALVFAVYCEIKEFIDTYGTI